MRQKLFSLLVGVLLILVLPTAAFADIGPKPSVQIDFTGSSGEVYYGTLLSERRTTGPSSAWDGTEEYARCQPGDADYAIWQAFVEYKDAEGFWFLQEWWPCSENDELNWTYYPPSTFKVLLYYPESETFSVSPIYTRYAFDSYYTVDLAQGAGAELQAVKSYDYTWETVSLLARIVLTILLELLIALLFAYREKKVLLFFAAVNAVTQIGLNVALNIVNYHAGSMAFVLVYLLLELLVIVAEAILYCTMLPRYSQAPQRKAKAIGYVLAANTGSFFGGLWLALAIPGIF